MADADDRTQAATPKRLQQAREQGQTPISREVVAFAALGAGALALSALGPSSGQAFVTAMRPLFDLTRTPGQAGWAAARGAAMVGAPLMAAVLIAGAGAVLGQTGLLLRTGALAPDFSRVSPARGAKRIFGATNLIEALKALVKLGVLAWATWAAIGSSLPGIAAAAVAPAPELGATVLHAVMRVAAPVLGAQALIAGADIAWQRLRHARAMRMSREEIKHENRDSEGDPRVKARVKQLRRARARSRMMQAVPKATVVVTNPTHYAVALLFDRASHAAPRVVAKGADEVAARIRALAQSSGVPVVSNPPLARALFRSGLETEIPAEHFQAVAEIIAYVWRLRAPLPARAANA